MGSAKAVQGSGARAKPKRSGRTPLNFRGYTGCDRALQARGDDGRFMAVVDPSGVDFTSGLLYKSLRIFMSIDIGDIGVLYAHEQSTSQCDAPSSSHLPLLEFLNIGGL